MGQLHFMEVRFYLKPAWTDCYVLLGHDVVVANGSESAAGWHHRRFVPFPMGPSLNQIMAEEVPGSALWARERPAP